jgi:hypothetical protein
MRFSMLHLPCEFEIPDHWLEEGGVIGFKPTSVAFRADRSASPVPLTAIEPVPRFRSTPKDWHGFDRARLVRILAGFVHDQAVEPVPVAAMPPDGIRQFA